jgi:hypothetical protein
MPQDPNDPNPDDPGTPTGEPNQSPQSPSDQEPTGTAQGDAPFQTAGAAGGDGEPPNAARAGEPTPAGQTPPARGVGGVGRQTPSGVGGQGGGGRGEGSGGGQYSGGWDHWLYRTPSAALVSVWGILLAMLFLLTLTVVLLYQIKARWPVCEITEAVKANDNQNGDGGANSNTDTGTAGTGANANANANGNENANAGAGANLNGGGDTRAAATPAATTTPAGEDAPADTTTRPASAAQSAPTRPDLDTVEPSSGPITGNTLVTLRGKGFATGDVVKFDNLPAKVGPHGSESITVRTPPHEEGTVDISVYRGKELLDTLPAAYTYTCPAPTGSSLFLMIIIAGALGGCIHALRSLYWYTGQGTLKWRWLPMYFILPFTGAATATIFSLLIVAGFVSNTTGRGESLFIIAVAGLVGMFSQQAALKLTDIANAFFTKPGEGRDANPQESLSVGAGAASMLTGTGMSLSSGTSATPVTITGTGFTRETTVHFGDLPAEVRDFTPTSITVVPPAQEAGTVVDVTVRSGGQTARLPASFTYE